MRRDILLIFCMVALRVTAQEEKLRMTFNLDVMSPVEVNVNDIREICFVTGENTLDVEGEWFDYEEGIFQSLKFSEDGTVEHYYYLTDYNIGDKENGKYWYEYDVFGIGLPTWGGRLYIPVVNHTQDSFTWRYNNNNLTYYKIKEIYEMNVGDDPISIGKGNDVVTYTDNVFVGVEDGKIKALQPGSGFVLVKDAKMNTTTAYRINIGQSDNIVKWPLYFGKTKDEIISEFGPSYRESSGSITYTGSAESICKYTGFSFDNNTEKVNVVSITFNKYEDLQKYYYYISENYVLFDPVSTTTRKTYYDSDKITTSSVMIIIDTSWMTIGYSDLKKE